MRLNMYRPERIDYFNRDKNGFLRRVGLSARCTTRVSPNAIELLWEFSAGNPYFLKK